MPCGDGQCHASYVDCLSSLSKITPGSSEDQQIYPLKIERLRKAAEESEKIEMTSNNADAAEENIADAAAEKTSGHYRGAPDGDQET